MGTTASSIGSSKTSTHRFAGGAPSTADVVIAGANNFNSAGLSETWFYQYQTLAAVEACVSGLDGDDDGLNGCADPDCFGYCSPLCSPALMTGDPSWPRWGCGSCQPVAT